MSRVNYSKTQRIVLSEVCSSIKQSAQENLTTTSAKVARFEMETASNKTWELPAGLADDITWSISHHFTEKEVKKKDFDGEPCFL